MKFFLAPGGPDHQNMALHTMGKLGLELIQVFHVLTFDFNRLVETYIQSH